MQDLEQWKPIEGFDNKYFISNFGNIRSSYKEQKKHIVNGYYRAMVSKYGNRKTYQLRIHREVAKAFIINPLNKPEVNHIDGNTFNNHVNNLEWNTRQENTDHAIYNNIFRRSARKIIYCPELKIATVGVAKMEYLLKNLGYNAYRSSIFSVLQKKRKHHLGLTFGSYSYTL